MLVHVSPGVWRPILVVPRPQDKPQPIDVIAADRAVEVILKVVTTKGVSLSQQAYCVGEGQRLAAHTMHHRAYLRVNGPICVRVHGDNLSDMQRTFEKGWKTRARNGVMSQWLENVRVWPMTATVG